MKNNNDSIELSKTKKEFWIRFYHTILDRSSMHGSWHLTQRHRHYLEFYFWFATMVLAGISAIYCASIFWMRYFTNPTVYTIQKDYMNWNTTFPSLTFCLHNKLNETAMREFITEENPKNSSQMEIFLRSLVNLSYNNLESLVDYSHIPTNQYANIIHKISNKITGPVTTTFGAEFKIQETLTDLGLCFAFNSKIAIFTSPDYINGIITPDDESTLLYESNYVEGDSFAVLKTLGTCNIHYHSPYEQMKGANFYPTDSNSSSYTNIVFTSMPISAGQNIRDLMIFQRKCRFSDESNLEYFPTMYSFSLCLTDCRIKLILKYCRCLPFIYKIKEEDSYCTSKGFRCLSHFQIIIESQLKYCNCLGNCEDSHFLLRSAKSVTWFREPAIRWELVKANIRVKRNVIYGLTDVLVATGANAGLFMGLSFLSCMEYFHLYFIHLPKKYYLFKKNQILLNLKK